MSKCQFTNIAVMPVTSNLIFVRSSQTRLRIDAPNVAGPSGSSSLLSHSASKELDGSVMAMAQKQNLLTQKAIQLQGLELQRKFHQQTHPRQRQRHHLHLQVKHPLQLRRKRRARLPRHRLPLKIKPGLRLKETEKLRGFWHETFLESNKSILYSNFVSLVVIIKRHHINRTHRRTL